MRQLTWLNKVGMKFVWTGADLLCSIGKRNGLHGWIFAPDESGQGGFGDKDSKFL